MVFWTRFFTLQGKKFPNLLFDEMISSFPSIQPCRLHPDCINEQHVLRLVCTIWWNLHWSCRKVVRQNVATRHGLSRTGLVEPHEHQWKEWRQGSNCHGMPSMQSIHCHCRPQNCLRSTMAFAATSRQSKPNPRKSFIADLHIFVAPCHAAGAEILLMGDFNKTPGDSAQGLDTIINKHNLLDLLLCHHGLNKEVDAFSCGSKRLDCALTSPSHALVSLHAILSSHLTIVNFLLILTSTHIWVAIPVI
jgi:hypothetical protein